MTKPDATPTPETHTPEAELQAMTALVGLLTIALGRTQQAMAALAEELALYHAAADAAAKRKVGLADLEFAEFVKAGTAAAGPHRPRNVNHQPTWKSAR